MKKLFFLLILTAIMQNVYCQHKDYDKIKAMAKPFGDSIIALVREYERVGFSNRRGDKIRGGTNGEQRYEVINPIECFNSKTQYISVINGKEYYVFTIKGENLAWDVLIRSRDGIFSNYGSIPWSKDLLFYDINSNMGTPKDEWYNANEYFRLNTETQEGPRLLWIRFKLHPNETTVLVGTFPEYAKMEDEVNKRRMENYNATLISQYKTADEGEIMLALKACYLKNYTEAFKLFSKNLSSPFLTDTALGWLGYMYAQGMGVAVNLVEANKYFIMAANKGNAVAQNNVGYNYHEGRGFEQNFGEAIKWYTKSANQGNWDAQVNLGLMYEKGEGVKQDDFIAVEWYRKAALQAWGVGQYHLGLAYRNGKGVPIDNEKSQLLLGYAAGHGVEEANALYVKKETPKVSSSYTNPTNNVNENLRPIKNSSICVCCHGLGTVSRYDAGNTYQRYDHGTPVGSPTHSTNVTCTCCHGTGH